ncbi:MAG: stage 0 sporulation family protein [Clostridia bacterium]|nr:stage 0 sporulation family protein [Clostridia bacterium]
MAKIVGVRFRDGEKTYYFDPGEFVLKTGDDVIVETAHGTQIGKTVIPNTEKKDDEIVAPLKTVIRRATPKDLKQAEINKSKEADAFKICNEKIAKHGLDMKLISVKYSFDGSKILFYFTSSGRVDFRELVKDLAAVFKTRIELRQIGVRDEAKMLGGLGICGRSLCCATHLSDFQPVSIKMAKEQCLSLNPTKISGCCGRLMCCLKYEQDTYDELIKITPREGSIVKTPDGNKGIVESVTLLTGKIRVKLDKDDENILKEYHRDELKILKHAKVKEDKTDDEELKGLE